MENRRRDFIKGCAASCIVLLPGVAAAMKSESASQQIHSNADAAVEKSIKAGFGGGFSVKTHTQANGMTYASIEHAGNRYSVASADLLDWQIISVI